MHSMGPTWWLLLLLLLALLSVASASDGELFRSRVAQRLQMNITCDLCKLFAALFDEGLRLNWTETVFLSAAADLCADVSSALRRLVDAGHIRALT
jgi:hypothetical protein